MAEINLQLLRHKILLGLDDRGKLSCHKVNLCFIYFDTHECVVSFVLHDDMFVSSYDLVLLMSFRYM